MSNTIKKLILCLVSVVLIFCGTVAVFAASSKSYVGNKSTKVYHISECTYASKISTKNRVYFPSRAAAEINGYRRCHYCGDDVVNPGHGGGSGSGSHSNSGSINVKPTESQTTVEKPQKENNTNKEKTLGNIILAVIFLFYAYSFIRIFLFEAIRNIFIWLRNRNRKKRSLIGTEKQKESQLAIETAKTKQLLTSYTLNSSVISEVEFQDNVIYITFQTGGVYSYYNVPRKVYDGLVASQSPGKYFHDHIKDKYPFAPYHK